MRGFKIERVKSHGTEETENLLEPKYGDGSINVKEEGAILSESLMDRDLQAVCKWTVYAKMMCPLSAECPQPAL